MNSTGKDSKLTLAKSWKIIWKEMIQKNMLMKLEVIIDHEITMIEIILEVEEVAVIVGVEDGFIGVEEDGDLEVEEGGGMEGFHQIQEMIEDLAPQETVTHTLITLNVTVHQHPEDIQWVMNKGGLSLPWLKHTLLMTIVGIIHTEVDEDPEEKNLLPLEEDKIYFHPDNQYRHPQGDQRLDLDLPLSPGMTALVPIANGNLEGDLKTRGLEVEVEAKEK